jgi:hypothetical protein
MKMFRPALVGALPAFVLFVCVQLNAHAASTPPSPGQPVATLYKVPLPPRPMSLRRPSQGNSSLRIVSLTSERLKKSTGVTGSGQRSVVIPSHRSMR